MASGFQIEGLEEILKTLRTLPEELEIKKRRAILKKSALIFKDAARRKVPVGGKSHKRYKDGVVVAEYSPGNLRDSINVMTFRRAKTAVFVGAKIKKGGSESDGLILGDGYYAHMVEMGALDHKKTPFMRPAFEENKGIVKADIEKQIKRVVDNWIRKNSK